jgi:hypothetical protein
MSEYEISDEPNAEGYYVLKDTITSSNGGTDCEGGVTPVGDHAVNYLKLIPGGVFFICTRPRADYCFGALTRSVRTDS